MVSFALFGGSNKILSGKSIEEYGWYFHSSWLVIDDTPEDGTPIAEIAQESEYLI